ncbi:SLAM family member 5 [Oryzias melastigma]|uniref:SLAM family member 5 n=1 Tax=Oryzias melastigma TaxID=30732 RepID=A0A834FDS3_ORYME|nr:SLAM family member 5 [Oryzias melastigma]
METMEKVSAYVGESVNLTSAAKIGQSLVRIEWSIYTNTTWIATFRDGKVNTERHPQFMKRLHLNTKSGDLTITNLTLKDAMIYSVEFIYSNEPSSSTTTNQAQPKKIELEVKYRLQAPTIQKIASSATREGCFITLNCSSSEKDVSFSWKVSPPSMNYWRTEKDPSYILVHTDSKQDLIVTCSSTKGEETAHQEFSAECEVFTEESSNLRDRWTLLFVFGTFGGVALILLIYICETTKSDEAADPFMP